jgi:hypothetical protein
MARSMIAIRNIDSAPSLNRADPYSRLRAEINSLLDLLFFIYGKHILTDPMIKR